MTLEIQPVSVRQGLEFPIMLKQMTDEECKEYHLKRLGELILKSIERGTFYNRKLTKSEEEREQRFQEWIQKIEREETYFR